MYKQIEITISDLKKVIKAGVPVEIRDGAGNTEMVLIIRRDRSEFITKLASPEQEYPDITEGRYSCTGIELVTRP